MFRNDDKTHRSILPRTFGMIPKEAFLAWMEAGSLPKARLMLHKNGVYNKRTGKPFTEFGVRAAACRYIALNHEECRPILLKAWKEADVEISLEEWQKFVVELAVGNLSTSKRRFFRWLEANPFAKKYDYLYARKYGLEPENRPEV